MSERSEDERFAELLNGITGGPPRAQDERRGLFRRRRRSRDDDDTADVDREAARQLDAEAGGAHRSPAQGVPVGLPPSPWPPQAWRPDVGGPGRHPHPHTPGPPPPGPGPGPRGPAGGPSSGPQLGPPSPGPWAPVGRPAPAPPTAGPAPGTAPEPSSDTPPEGVGWIAPEYPDGPRTDEPPESSFVRPYAWTRGRTRPAYDLAVETLLSTTDHGRDPARVTQYEHRMIAELCERPKSVAEVAALLSLPLGVARVLLGDMAAHGSIVVHETAASTGDSPDMALMERVLSGLRRL